jgi:pimeloyl-ACP methyl ester carboxylesterase
MSRGRRSARLIALRIGVLVLWTVADAQEHTSAIDSTPPLQVHVSDVAVHLTLSDANDIRFSCLSRSQGLSQTRVTRIVQDDRGFIWLATQYGLNRYDGYRFKVFKHDATEPKSICGVYMQSLFKDRASTETFTQTPDKAGETIMSESNTGTQAAIVLVHGGFVDGSGWEDVYKILKKDGYAVSIVQNPTLSLADDVAVTKRAIAAQGKPVVLVGHSYGGAVITEAGNDPKVAALVYIAAFAPDKGESVGSLIKDAPPGAPVPPILPPQDGFLFLDANKFAASFAADVPTDKADFMAQSQVPWGLAALNGSVTEAAWRRKPSWYLVASDDKMIPPPAQRAMSKRAESTVVEVKGSHAVYVSRPEAVAALIEKAAQSVTTTAAG